MIKKCFSSLWFMKSPLPLSGPTTKKLLTNPIIVYLNNIMKNYRRKEEKKSKIKSRKKVKFFLCCLLWINYRFLSLILTTSFIVFSIKSVDMGDISEILSNIALRDDISRVDKPFKHTRVREHVKKSSKSRTCQYVHQYVRQSFELEWSWKDDFEEKNSLY